MRGRLRRAPFAALGAAGLLLAAPALRADDPELWFGSLERPEREPVRVKLRVEPRGDETPEVSLEIHDTTLAVMDYSATADALHFSFEPGEVVFHCALARESDDARHYAGPCEPEASPDARDPLHVSLRRSVGGAEEATPATPPVAGAPAPDGEAGEPGDRDREPEPPE